MGRWKSGVDCSHWVGERPGVRLESRLGEPVRSPKITSAMSGNFIYRHHVEPRVKLYSPREESFPVPLKYIDVSRTTRTNLDVMQESRIDDYWTIDGSRDLCDSWTGFTRFALLEEKPPEGCMWSRVETDKTASDIQARSFMARTLERIGKKCKAEGQA